MGIKIWNVLDEGENKNGLRKEINFHSIFVEMAKGITFFSFTFFETNGLNEKDNA